MRLSLRQVMFPIPCFTVYYLGFGLISATYIGLPLLLFLPCPSSSRCCLNAFVTMLALLVIGTQITQAPLALEWSKYELGLEYFLSPPNSHAQHPSRPDSGCP